MNPNLEHKLVDLRPSVTKEELGQKGPNWGTRGMKGILGNLEEKGIQKEKKENKKPAQPLRQSGG